jgi:hypothetical protein
MTSSLSACAIEQNADTNSAAQTVFVPVDTSQFFIVSPPIQTYF